MIEGNLIGTDAHGIKPLGNGGTGVELEGVSVTLGGTILGARNVISGNGGDGVYAATGDLIEGNDIGTDASGFVRLANAGDGIDLGGPNNTIGGTNALAQNVISGNAGSGVMIVNVSDNLIEGNHIGSGTPSTSPINVGNGGDGVTILSYSPEDQGPDDNTIGGLADGAGNEIAYNGGNGVTVASSSLAAVTFAPTGDAILGNSVFSNAKLGIDLGNDGQTRNTPGGPHTGPNDLQNDPVINSAVSADETVTLGGTLNSTPSTTFVLQFFGNLHEVSPGVFGSAVVMGTASVTTNTQGNATFSENYFDFGGSYSATATDPGGNTSEFSPVYLQSTAPAPDLRLSVTPVTASPVLTNNDYNYSVTITNAGPQDASNVVLSNALGAGSTLHTITTAGAITNLSPTLTNVTFASLASGASVTVGLFVRAASAGVYNDAASVTANEADPDETNNSAAVTDTVVAPSADLRLTMSSPTPNPVQTNKDYNYSVTITNVGPQDASSVVLSDALGAGSTLHTITTAGAITNISPTMTNVAFARLAAGASVTVGFFVRAASPGIYNDTAFVTANEADPDETNNAASVIEKVVAPPPPATADLLVVGTVAPDIATVGRALTYTFTVSNKGPSPATDVKLSDMLPEGVSFVSVKSGLGTGDFVGGLVTTSIGTLDVGATATVTLVAIPSVAGTISDTASVGADQPDPHPADNQVTVLVATALDVPINVFSSLMKTSKGPYQVLVTWGYPDSGSTGIGFNVYRVDASGSEIKISGPTGTSAHDFVDTGAEANKTCEYRVTAFVGNGESAVSDETTITVTLDSSSGLGVNSSKTRGREASGPVARSERRTAKAGKPATIHRRRPGVLVNPSSQARRTPVASQSAPHES